MGCRPDTLADNRTKGQTRYLCLWDSPGYFCKIDNWLNVNGCKDCIPRHGGTAMRSTRCVPLDATEPGPQGRTGAVGALSIGAVGALSACSLCEEDGVSKDVQGTCMCCVCERGLMGKRPYGNDHMERRGASAKRNTQATPLLKPPTPSGPRLVLVPSASDAPLGVLSTSGEKDDNQTIWQRR